MSAAELSPGPLAGPLPAQRAVPSTAHAATALVTLYRLFDRLGIEPAILAEFSILGGNGCAHQIGRDIRQRFPVAFGPIAVEQHGQRRRDGDKAIGQHQR